MSVKTKKAMRHRGIRFEDKKWDKFVEIAEEESKKTGTKVTASDVVRHAGDFYLENRGKKFV